MVLVLRPASPSDATLDPASPPKTNTEREAEEDGVAEPLVLALSLGVGEGVPEGDATAAAVALPLPDGEAAPDGVADGMVDVVGGCEGADTEGEATDDDEGVALELELEEADNDGLGDIVDEGVCVARADDDPETEA